MVQWEHSNTLCTFYHEILGAAENLQSDSTEILTVDSDWGFAGGLDSKWLRVQHCSLAFNTGRSLHLWLARSLLKSLNVVTKLIIYHFANMGLGDLVGKQSATRCGAALIVEHRQVVY